MSSLLTDRVELIKCTQCNQRMSGASLLACLHSVCSSCQSTCALCGKENLNKVNNYFLRSVCTLAECHSSSRKPCDNCQDDDHDANSRCIQCADNLCPTCTDAHRRTKLTRSHTLAALEDIRNRTYDTDIRNHQYVSCDKHEGESLKYMCNREDVLICRECRVSEHDKHPCQDINDAAEQYKQSTQGLLNKVDQMIPNMVEYELLLKDYTIQLMESKEKLKNDIQSQADCVHKMIDEYTTRMIEQVEASVQEESKTIEEKIKNIDEMIKVFKSTTLFVGTLLTHSKSDEMLSIRKEVTARLIELGQYRIDPVKDKLSLYYSPGTTTQGNLEILFGKLDVFKVPMNDKRVEAFIENNITPNIDPKFSIADNIEELLCFESRGASDTRDIWPTGVDVDIDGNMIILDRDNKKIKVFNHHGKFIREFGQNGIQNLQCPYDLTILTDDSIAVTDYEDEDIKVFSPMGMFLKSIKADFKYPRGITTSSIGELIVVDCHSHRLTIHDPETGNIIREIRTNNKSCDPMLTDPYYVTTNPSGHIIVTDWTAPNIKFFDSHGQFLTKYATYGVKKDQVLQPYGICVDKYGQIFLADNQNHRIHLLTPDGSFIKFLVTKQHGLWHPMAVAIDLCGNLIVTEALGKVKVFKYI